MRDRYVGVRGENASENRAMAETGVVVAHYSSHSIYLGVHYASEDNCYEKMCPLTQPIGAADSGSTRCCGEIDRCQCSGTSEAPA